MRFILQRILRGALYIKNHPQIIFALLLVIVIPLLFLYTGQKFLEVGKANQDRLQKDKVGIMHDVLATLLVATNFNASTTAAEMKKLVDQNPDITDYIISQSSPTGLVPIVARDESLLQTRLEDTDLYSSMALRTDESLIHEYSKDGARVWGAYRSIRSDSGVLYFIYTEHSFKAVDTLLASRERSAYVILIFIYLFLLGLAYWHIKLTDYQYLYTESQKAIETKDLFTNMIAHELRAPLTAIHGYANILTSHLENQTDKEQAHRIEDSAERLITIVNDLLDVARIQSGKLAITLSPTEVAPIINDVIAELQVVASVKGSQLVNEITDVPHSASIDASRFHQVLTNIVSNAIKYTEQGKISVSLEETYRTVEIRVKDTGMGISSADQQKLFAPFFRVTNESMSTITGTGLGMWITKQLVELMGGTIGVESIKGVGTHIVLTLPKVSTKKAP